MIEKISTNPFAEINQRFNDLESLLISLTEKVKTKPVQINPHERLTRAQVKSEYKISYGSIHNGMKAGKLSYDKLGRKTLFKRVEVENWINKKA